jgi:hypothetical protein
MRVFLSRIFRLFVSAGDETTYFSCWLKFFKYLRTEDEFAAPGCTPPQWRDSRRTTPLTQLTHPGGVLGTLFIRARQTDPR